MPNNYYFDPRYDDGLERYSRERYAQESIPSTNSWRKNARDVAEYGRAMERASDELAADYERYYRPQAEAMRRKAMYAKRPRDWSNRDIEEIARDRMSFMGDYVPQYNPDMDRKALDIPTEYTDGMDTYKDALYEMRYEDMLAPHSLEPAEQQSRASAFLFGYNPNPSEDFGWKDAAEFGIYAAPVVGNAYYASELVDRVREGAVPGFLEGALAVPIAGHVLKRAPKYLRGLKNFRAQQEARRAFEMELDKRALTRPRPNTKAWTGRRFEDVYVDPNMEFTPYEEVRF